MDWPEPKEGAGEGIGPLYGAGMYAQYDYDKKLHKKQLSDAISLIRGKHE